MRAVVPTVAVFAPLLLAPAAAEAKDAWDKLESVSGLISGILVAVIGAIATYIYNDRQSKAQARQAEREVAVQQVQTVATLMPSLRSTDPLEKETALLSISELGNPQLAVRLATLYRDEGSVGALTRIAAHSADREAAAAAAESLDEILEALRASVVEVVGSRGPMATGFVVRPDGLTLTTDYSGHNIKSVKVEDGGQVACHTVKVLPEHGIAVLQLDEPGPPPLTLHRADGSGPLGEVICLGFTPEGWVSSVGRVEGPTQQAMAGAGYQGTLLESSLRSEPGNAGAPVLNRAGKVVAILYGGRVAEGDQHTALLLPVGSVRAGLEQLGIVLH